jgi:hypothetical protein
MQQGKQQRNLMQRSACFGKWLSSLSMLQSELFTYCTLCREKERKQSKEQQQQQQQQALPCSPAQHVPPSFALHGSLYAALQADWRWWGR